MSLFYVLLDVKVLHCSIFWFMWGVQLSVLSIVTPKYRVDSTVFSLDPFIHRRVKIFLFLGENTIATVFSGLNVRLAALLLSTRWLRTVCILSVSYTHLTLPTIYPV